MSAVGNQLTSEIKYEFEELRNKEVGTEEHKIASDVLTKFLDRMIELEKLEVNVEEKAKDREAEERFKLQQMAEERKGRIIRDVITVATTVSMLVYYIWGTKASFRFEETGTITTNVGRKIMDSVVPKWKLK